MSPLIHESLTARAINQLGIHVQSLDTPRSAKEQLTTITVTKTTRTSLGNSLRSGTSPFERMSPMMVKINTSILDPVRDDGG